MLILCAIVGVLLCLTCLFFFVVHPLICIVECAISQNLSGGQKALWIFLSLFLGVIGSLPYALLASGSRVRSLTLNGMKFGALNLLVGIGVFAGTPQLRDMLSVPMGDASMQSMAFDSNAMTDSLGEISATLDAQTNGAIGSPQAEQPRFVSAFAPVPTVENALDSNNLAEMAPKLENPSENTTFLEDLNVDATEAVSVPESAWLPQENVEATVTQESKESTLNQPLESETQADTSIASKAHEEPLPIRELAEPKTKEVEPLPQPKRRDTQLSAMTQPEKPSMKKPINRYRTEGYDMVEITLPNNTMPQPLTVRNRYKNP